MTTLAIPSRPTFFTEHIRELETADSGFDAKFLYRGLLELYAVVYPVATLGRTDPVAESISIFIDTILDIATEVALDTWDAPPELKQAVEDFRTIWRSDIHDRRKEVLDAAERVSYLAQGWQLPQGASQQNLAKAQISWKVFFAAELVFLFGSLLVLYSDFFNQNGVASGLFLLFLSSVIFKVSIMKILTRESTNLSHVDKVLRRFGAMVFNKDVFVGMAVQNPLAGDLPANYGYETGIDDNEHNMKSAGDTAEEGGDKAADGAFLLPPEQVSNRRISVENLLAEADDDDGWMVLRLAGNPNVKIQMPALNRHLMIVVTDRQGKVMFWNDGATFVCGFSSRDVQGKPVTTFIYGSKSAETYERMVEGAARGVVLSSKTLTLASTTYGFVPVRATVVPAASNDRHIGYVIIASQVEGGHAKSQALLHQLVVRELREELHSIQPENDKDGPGLVRCHAILDKLKWSVLQDAANAARDWKTMHLHSCIGEALFEMKVRDLRLKPNVPEVITGDQKLLSDVVRRLVQLIPGKAVVELDHRPYTETIQVLVITMSPYSGNHEEDLHVFNTDLAGVCGDVSAVDDKLVLAVPYLVEGSSGLNSTQQAELATAETRSSHPMTLVLLESNPVFRHNLSSVIWAAGHSMRLMNSLAQASAVVREKGSEIDCAIIDADIREVDPLLRMVQSHGLTAILTTENPQNIGPNRLLKPIDNKVLFTKLEEIALQVHEKKLQAEEVVRQREVFGKVRNSPWARGKKLGRGAFADVYEATSTLTGGKMAVKTIRAARGVDHAEWMNSLLNEIQILCSLSHPNIVHYFYCESGEGGTINLFMELAADGSIGDVLLRQRVMAENKIGHMVKELLRALDYLHTTAGITHRDIKPGNILLSNGKVKLSDFGTATNQVAMDTQGTVSYMAPEVIEGKQYGKPCDIWSVGCVVCECAGITREPVDNGMLGFKAPTQFPTNVSSMLIDFVKSCMQFDPNERPTAGALLIHPFITEASVGSSVSFGSHQKHTASVAAWSVDSGDAIDPKSNETSQAESVAEW